MIVFATECRVSHFANVVQQRPASDVAELIFRDSQHAGELYRQLSHALCVALGFLVAQIERADQPSIVAS